MSVVPSPSPQRATPPGEWASGDDRVIRLAGLLTTSLVALAVWPIWRYALASGNEVPLLVHLNVLGVAVAVLWARRRLPRQTLDWLPLALGPYLYVALRWVIEGIGRPHRDATVMGWERLLFPTNPSATLAPQWASAALSEALHLAYASYYAIVLVPPLLLYARGRRDAFAETMLALVIVYGACYLAYALFPVDGPRYLIGAAAAPDGPVRSMVLAILEGGSSRGTAFPSSHVAASVVAMLCALRHQPRIGAAVALCAAGLAIATVYGGFHYAVDAAAGALLGVAAWLFASRLSARAGS
jgi:membrane-associated phospholipid phosphatase